MWCIEHQCPDLRKNSDIFRCGHSATACLGSMAVRLSASDSRKRGRSFPGDQGLRQIPQPHAAVRAERLGGAQAVKARLCRGVS